MASGDSATYPFTQHASSHTGFLEATSCFSPLRSSGQATAQAPADAVAAQPTMAQSDSAAERIKLVICEEERHRQEQHERQMVAEKQMVKDFIKQARSPIELLERAEVLVKEDWLGHIDELPGDIFTIAAFGDLTKHKLLCDFNSVQAVVRFMGCLCICAIQFLSGPVVFLSTTRGWGLLPGQEFAWHAWESANQFADWDQWSKKLMGLLFLFCFLLNGIFVILEERSAWFKIYALLNFLDDGTPNFRFRTRAFLWISAFLDCWNAIWCSLACYVVVGASETPKDVLMDSLGMLFLYNLEKVGGDLTFVDADDWPGDRLGWIYEEWIHKHGESIRCDDAIQVARAADRDASQKSGVCSSALHDVENLDSGERMGLLGYTVTVWILAGMVVVLPVVSVLTPFRLIAPEMIENG